ncbi:piggyBac transposable element-derived protein 3-like [Cydia pomonella]|uniref:piggyBac transposable element-derived protein 3-like n=1 Tax=Cydia pomonella TaxID=82600 RepID=UPI002ADDD039|nr:piggyBac transposable element-derived protein 3-like [Cydia pomonella]
MNINFKWTKKQFEYRAELGDDNFQSPLPEGNKTALSYFFDFFSQDMFEQICNMTNLYSVQKRGRSVNLTVEELKSFLAIKIMMGIVSMPSYLDYWRTETRYAPIADIMTLKRYQLLRSCIHFVDNDDANNDPYFKISSVVEKVRRNCLAVEEEKRFSIDEMTIPYKGTKAGKKRQYNPRKPRKWGFKNIVRAGASGFIYDFFLYTGQDEFEDCGFTEEEAALGWGAKAVLRLCKTIKNKPCVVYFDNFFSSLELIYHLRHTYGIFSLGTMRSNRLRDSQTHLKTDKELKAQGRGAFCQTTCNENKVAVVKWNDNKCVVLASSYSDAYPLSTVKRYCKIKKQKINVQYQNIVEHYNAHMGGIDLADMLVALYRTEMKTRRWYLSIFSQIIDICVNNAWLMYRRDSKRKGIKKYLGLKQFRLQIYQGLLKADKRASGLVPTVTDVIRKPNRILPVDDVKYDGLDHLPNFLDMFETSLNIAVNFMFNICCLQHLRRVLSMMGCQGPISFCDITECTSVIK